jgi:flagellar hook-length control protein FliK
LELASQQRLLAEMSAAGQNRLVQQTDSPVHSARLLRRVARAFVALGDGGGEVRLKLSPPALGGLRLEVKLHEGAIVARVETETSAARIALIENLPALRERLAEQGVRVERFDVDVMQRHPRGGFDRPTHQQAQASSQPALTQPRIRRVPQVAGGVVARTTYPNELDLRRLNVVV